MKTFLGIYSEATITALGFFWKAGWAFVLGYFISSMIQTFVPKEKLTKYMGKADFESISLSTIFGAISSSCSFAALATARSLLQKGAHFVAVVAFMFASTNLVIELGILILIFLGWEYLIAEIIGGLVLILISSIIIKLTYPEKWIKWAKKRVNKKFENQKENFDWKQRIRSKQGWRLVGHQFVEEWNMVWEEILIGFTIAGFVAVLVPTNFWNTIFLTNYAANLPQWLITLENALVAPFVAASTFIGSMGNIPLATVLSENGVLFAGIMGFIYSDLMVPPLVAINAKYYGKKVAYYIAVVMYISIVLTALILNGVFGYFGLIPESKVVISEVARFKIDYTLFLNIFFVIVSIVLIKLNNMYMNHKRNVEDMEGKSSLKRRVAYAFIVILSGGLLTKLIFAFL